MITIFKPYSNIKDFLYRFTILKIGKIHIRLHKIKSEDKTTLFHNHPFNYISIILKGGYQERYICQKSSEIKSKKYNFLNVIFGNNKRFHRIEKIKGETITLFITYGKYEWHAINMSKNNLENGIFKRKINNKSVWSKRENGIWFI